MRPTSALLLALCLTTAALPAAGQSLKGSKQSMERQNLAARKQSYSFLKTSSGVRTFARKGLLVKLKGNAHYKLDDEVSFPYARPEVKQFVERLSSQYSQACGEKLVVTSLTRPLTRQPSNASHLSVHPTGMAVDFRKSWHSACRKFMEKNLLALEQKKVLEATKEFWPPHYHVTVFPAPYLRYVAQLAAPAQRSRTAAAVPAKGSRTTQKTVVAANRGSRAGQASRAQRAKVVRVGRGDSLWTISQRHGVTVAALKRANGIRSSHVQAGQRLQIPAR